MAHPRNNELALYVRGRCEAVYAETGRLLTDVRAVRTSSHSVSEWQASAGTTFGAADRRNPDVEQAYILGFDVVRRDASGQAQRAELGEDVLDVREFHVPGGGSRRSIGVILRVGMTLFVYLLDSARESNLEAETEDRAGNAVTEVISTVVREMWKFGRMHDGAYRPQLFAREHDRLVRQQRHGAALADTLEACRALVYTPSRLDMATEEGKQAFMVNSWMTSASLQSAVKRMGRTEIVMQAEFGAFYEDVTLAPFTHGPSTVREVDRRTGRTSTSVDVHQLAVVDDVDGARATLRELVDVILHSGTAASGWRPDWKAVGSRMYDLGLPLRMPAYRKHGFRPDPGEEDWANTWAGAALSLFSEHWIEGWRTGSFRKVVPIKVPFDMTGLDWEIVETTTVRGKKAKQAVVCRINMPLPEDGWGIRDDEWDQVLALRYPKERAQRMAGAAMPLGGLPSWLAAGFEWRMKTNGPGRYEVFRGPVRASEGRSRRWHSWFKGADHVATIRAAELHADIARAATQALTGFEGSLVPLWRGASQPVRRGGDEGAESRRKGLARELEAAECRLDGALDSVNECRGALRRASGEDRKRAEGRLERVQAAYGRAEAAVEELRERLESLDGGVDGGASRPDEVEGWASTATLEFAVAALGECAGSGPAWLRQACTVMLRDLKVSVSDDPAIGLRRRLGWSATLVMAVRTDDGADRQVGLPMSGVVFDRSNPAATMEVRPGPESWAWSFFCRGMGFAEIGEACGGIDGSGRKNSYLYKGLFEWVSSVMGDAIHANAALAVPIHETRRVMWWMVTGDESAVASLDRGFVEHIAGTYSAASLIQTWGWCQDSHTRARDVADYLLERGGSAPVLQISKDLGIGYNELVALTRVKSTPTKPDAKLPAKAAVSPFTKNWSRGGTCLPPEDRQLSLRECPHADCPERLGGGTPFASHVLTVPETLAGHGVLCPSCRRLPVPALSKARFPAGYLRPWRGRFGTGSATAKAACRERSTLLDPARSHKDPGPGPALPATSTGPRPETRVNVRYSQERTRGLEGTQLKGRLFLLVGLAEDAQAELAALIRERGGRVGSKLTRGVACVVAASGPAGVEDHRLAKVRDLGIEVVTPGVLRARLRASWSPAERVAA